MRSWPKSTDRRELSWTRPWRDATAGGAAVWRPMSGCSTFTTLRPASRRWSRGRKRHACRAAGEEPACSCASTADRTTTISALPRRSLGCSSGSRCSRTRFSVSRSGRSDMAGGLTRVRPGTPWGRRRGRVRDAFGTDQELTPDGSFRLLRTEVAVLRAKGGHVSQDFPPDHISKRTVVYRLPGVDAVRVRRDEPFGATESGVLAMDLY